MLKAVVQLQEPRGAGAGALWRCLTSPLAPALKQHHFPTEGPQINFLHGHTSPKLRLPCFAIIENTEQQMNSYSLTVFYISFKKWVK